MVKISRQSGAAQSNPSFLKRWLQSQLLNHLMSDKRASRARDRSEQNRQREGRPHVVEYFHQVDDGYSHLAIQVLSRLVRNYRIELIVHLVKEASDANNPEPALLRDLARTDSMAIAPYYGLGFPESSRIPEQRLCDLALSILVRLKSEEFVSTGVFVSDCLWRGDEAGLRALAEQHGAASPDTLQKRISEGCDRRSALKHYSGAMFYYEGEWYWGVDRLSYLEDRLRSLLATSGKSTDWIAPRRIVTCTFPKSASEMTLEYYVSLRSPYTAVSWRPTLDMAKASNVQLKICPVLPMVMRGVSVTFQKGFYVFQDAAREARSLGVDFGRFSDPIGTPIEQAYSIYMWALEKNRGTEFFGTFLDAVFAKGINTNRSAGMRHVVEAAGLDWNEAKHHLARTDWHDMVEQNRRVMYEAGIWGVPSYRLLDRYEKPVLSVWGQDRLWLVSRKIAELEGQ